MSSLILREEKDCMAYALERRGCIDLTSCLTLDSSAIVSANSSQTRLQNKHRKLKTKYASLKKKIIDNTVLKK